MDPLLTKLGEAVELGKVDKNSPYPPISSLTPTQLPIDQNIIMFEKCENLS